MITGASTHSQILKKSMAMNVSHRLAKMYLLLDQSFDPQSLYSRWIKDSEHAQKLEAFFNEFNNELKSLSVIFSRSEKHTPLLPFPSLSLKTLFIDAIRNLNINPVYLANLLVKTEFEDMLELFQKNIKHLETVFNDFSAIYELVSRLAAVYPLLMHAVEPNNAIDEWGENNDFSKEIRELSSDVQNIFNKLSLTTDALLNLQDDYNGSLFHLNNDPSAFVKLLCKQPLLHQYYIDRIDSIEMLYAMLCDDTNIIESPRTFLVRAPFRFTPIRATGTPVRGTGTPVRDDEPVECSSSAASSSCSTSRRNGTH